MSPTRQSNLYSDKRVISLVGHGLQIAWNTTIVAYSLDLKQPETFCLTFAILWSFSALLLVNDTCGSLTNNSTFFKSFPKVVRIWFSQFASSFTGPWVEWSVVLFHRALRYSGSVSVYWLVLYHLAVFLCGQRLFCRFLVVDVSCCVPKHNCVRQR